MKKKCTFSSDLCFYSARFYDEKDTVTECCTDNQASVERMCVSE